MSAGSGGLGGASASRLTKILQEKAALLRKQRDTAEQAFHLAQERLRQLESLEITIPEGHEKEAQIQELVRRSEWASVESQSNELLDFLASSATGVFEKKRKSIAERGEKLVQFGLTLPGGFAAALTAVSNPNPGRDWGETVGALADLDGWIRAAQVDFSSQMQTRAHAYAEWAGLEPKQVDKFDKKVAKAIEPILEGRLAEGVEAVEALLSEEVPEGAKRHQAVRSMGTEILAAGRDLGVPTTTIETALQGDADAPPVDWPRTVPAMEAAGTQLADSLRDRVAQVIEGLRRTLVSVKEYDVDPTESLVTVEDVAARLPQANATELPQLLRQARTATEEPVVAIVASLLDAVRPRLVEARRLGRDASEVFAAMNRAREALRLKIYSEALAASQEAVDRVSQVTGDLETARAEADSLKSLLDRLAPTKFPTRSFEEALRRANALLDRGELGETRELLAQTIRRLGSETVAYFSERFALLDRVVAVAQERGFLPADVPKELGSARQLLEDGQLADAGERAAALEVRLRDAAGPYVARRIEELEGSFREIPDESLVAPVKRLLADADVNLRVKEDLAGSVESLKRAEREFSAVFAAHASTLVEMLEEERKVLEGMGGTGDEIQRQIDEVQQIFNMGDFVKASRTSQEIRTRAQQQQLVRSEEAVSHAKLAVVELGKMGLDAGPLRDRLDAAVDAAKDRRYSDAYRFANAVQVSAQETKTTAQRILDGMATATELWQSLKQAGVAVDVYREQLRVARTAYQALDFEGALATLKSLTESLAAANAETEARRLLAEIQLLTEDTHRLSIHTEALSEGRAKAQKFLDDGKPRESVEQARRVHGELLMQLRPVLTEQLRSVEQDFEVARSAGLDTPEIADQLGEARRRLGLVAPTGAAELIEKARAQLVETRGFLDHSERVVRRARDALNEAEMVHVDVHRARADLGTIEAALARKEYARVIELGSTLEREMIQAASQQVSKALGGVQAMIARARHQGSDTALAENLLRQARGALEEGKLVEALQKAARSESEFERIELQVRIAQGAIETMQRKIEEAKAEGVRTTDADYEARAAQTALDRRAFPDVLTHAMTVTDVLDAAREGHRRTRDALDSADRQLKEALELGADVQEILPRLNRARSLHQTGGYAEATHLARESAEAARWGIERQYSTALEEVRGLLATASKAGVTGALDGVKASVDDAESALKNRDWRRANAALARARTDARNGLEALVVARGKSLQEQYVHDGPPSAEETGLREQVRARVAAERAGGSYAGALALLAEEESRVKGRLRQSLQQRLNELKDRLWVGEKFGLDTTPVMELFSEAGLAVQSGQLVAVDSLIQQADTRLRTLVGGRLNEKLEEVQTELNFAREGLHVAVEPVAAQVGKSAQLKKDGDVITAARILLEAEEELNRRKALHRELTNIHYLIDATLARAAERHLDTAPARRLLEESIQVRAADYSAALTKARQALQLLQSQLKTTETPTGFWAFRRPPTSA